MRRNSATYHPFGFALPRFLFLLLLLISASASLLTAQETEGRKIEGLSFQIQVKASNKPLNKQELIKKYHLESIREYYHKGIYKYATGEFLRYDEAAAYRDLLVQRQGLTDIFIIAVKDNVILDSWSRKDIGIKTTSKTEKAPEKKAGTPPAATQDKKVTATTNTTVKKPEQTPAPVAEKKSAPTFAETGKTKPEQQVTEKPDSVISDLPDNHDTIANDTSSAMANQGKKDTANHFQETIVSDNDESFLKRMNRYYMNFLEDNISGSRIVYIAFTLSLIFTITLIILIIILAISRSIKNLKAQRLAQLQIRYQNTLMEYLFSEETHKTIPLEFLTMRSFFKREALIREILNLHEKMTGEIYDKLNYLYLQLALHTHSLEKLKSRKWHVVAQGIKELTQMDIVPATETIFKLTRSHNEIIRMEAQVAYLMMNKVNPFEFLDHYEHFMTEWEKLNIHYLITHHPIKIPEFSTWLNSDNHSVVIFCLQMIAIFKQISAIEKVEQIINHPDEEVQKYAIRCLSAFEYDECSPYLIEKYKQTTNETLKLEILDAMAKMSSPANIPFLEKILSEADTFTLKFKTAKALKSYGATGNFIIEKFARKDEEVLQIRNHLNDKRI